MKSLKYILLFFPLILLVACQTDSSTTATDDKATTVTANKTDKAAGQPIEKKIIKKKRNSPSKNKQGKEDEKEYEPPKALYELLKAKQPKVNPGEVMATWKLSALYVGDEAAPKDALGENITTLKKDYTYSTISNKTTTTGKWRLVEDKLDLKPDNNSNPSSWAISLKDNQFVWNGSSKNRKNVWLVFDKTN